ncbi:MAG: single-stranded-DNA-specific exonuclease RecJ [Gammaproteobacteria bacterium]|nr:single-stranded-DNA-specific exonuclease RecJ [Gammaproteobacteria bacterium]
MKTLSERLVAEDSLAELAQLHPVFQRVLSARGITSIAQTEYKLGNILQPGLIHNLSAAAKLLADKVQQQQLILVFGDYDADGATSTALCIRALTMMGHARVEYLMPDRFADGYGLSLSAAERIGELQPDCVITVDNGIASFDGIALLRKHGIDVIVTDHHLAADQLPNASVIVNQNAWAEETEGINLAGVGIAFYLMLALRSQLRESEWFIDARKEPNLASCLDLVAVGTVADLVPLDYVNRILVHEGLRRIRAGACSQGIQALIEVADKHLDNFTSTDIAFALAPRINAAGRLDDITVGVQCLLADDPVRAQGLARELNHINQQRKHIQQQIVDEAMQQLKTLDQQGLASQQAIVLYQPDWHEGIVGIVAAKLKEKYHRPCIVFGQAEDGSLKGSGRSISGIHLRDMLDAVDKRIPGKILKFGGHAMAAGLSLIADGYPEFSAIFESVVAKLADPNCFTNNIEYDGELDSDLFSLEFANDLQNLSPWGQRFPAPSFIGEFEVLSQKVLAHKHLKLRLLVSDDPHIPAVDAIAFFQPPAVLEQNHQQIRIHYELSVNRFRGSDSVQLLVRDIVLM